MNNGLQEIASNIFAKYFAQNVFHKKFVGNTCEFYNFVGNNYRQRNYLPNKICRKNSKILGMSANVHPMAFLCFLSTCNNLYFCSTMREVEMITGSLCLSFK